MVPSQQKAVRVDQWSSEAYCWAIDQRNERDATGGGISRQQTRDSGRIWVKRHKTQFLARTEMSAYSLVRIAFGIVTCGHCVSCAVLVWCRYYYWHRYNPCRIQVGRKQAQNRDPHPSDSTHSGILVLPIPLLSVLSRCILLSLRHFIDGDFVHWAITSHLSFDRMPWLWSKPV